MRGREFTMKDAYSFDRDLEGAKKRSYDRSWRCLPRIFDRFGLRTAQWPPTAAPLVAT
jgi:prolyl-tRNA synthetase